MKHFFINRPIFAIVISIVIVILGILSITKLAVEQYPNIIPPMVQVSASYTGANAEATNNSVAVPVSENVIGVENMLYMQTTSSNKGNMSMVVTFDIDSDPDLNTIFTQNRVSQSMALLPQSVVNEGVITNKTMTNFLMVIALSSDGRFSQEYLSNYAYINIRNEILKLNGIGKVEIMGASKYAMRVWVKPDKLNYLNISTQEITAAIQGQAGIFPVGLLGGEPSAEGTLYTYTLSLPTPINQASEFENIVIRTQPDGSQVLLKDIADVNLGTASYGSSSLLNGDPAAVIVIYQSPGSNAVDLGKEVDKVMTAVGEKLPDGVRYETIIDSTYVIKEGILEIVLTLIFVLVLVILIIYLFIQNTRATLIPLLAIPVSLIGTFLFFPVFGLTINIFTLLGLVLAVGLVVDDAIVIVEAVQLNIDNGMEPYEAVKDAMTKVTPAIIASTVVLASVFLPIAFMSGIAGKLFGQFALTIAISFIISGFNALSLTPALSLLLLRKEEKKEGRFFGWFNRFFESQKLKYLSKTEIITKHSSRALLLIAIVLGGIFVGFKLIPSGFLPEEDEGYILINFTLPKASSVKQTSEIGAQIDQILAANDNIASNCTIAGFNILSGIETPSNGVVFVKLKNWNERKQSAIEVAADLNRQLYEEVPGCTAYAFGPPSIPGLGNAAGFNIMLLDKGGNTPQYLAQNAQVFIDSVLKRKEISSAMTQFSVDVPQKEIVIDKNAVLKAGVDMNTLYATLSTYFGGRYIGNLNKFGQLYRTYIQADSPYRQNDASFQEIFVPNNRGESLPISSFVSIKDTVGVEYLTTFNLFPAVSVTGSAAKGYSSSDALDALEEVANQVLPNDMTYQWSDVSYQERNNASNSSGTYVFILIFVFLVLAALYENWSLPMSIILGIPVAVIGAVLMIFVVHYINPLFVDDIFFQISLVMLIALSSKNAILMIEYAHESYVSGKDLHESAMEAARLRFRPILMTALSFIIGLIPLLFAAGANAHSRNIIGYALLGGMMTATFIGIFIYPALYVFVSKKRGKKQNV